MPQPENSALTLGQIAETISNRLDGLETSTLSKKSRKRLDNRVDQNGWELYHHLSTMINEWRCNKKTSDESLAMVVESLGPDTLTIKLVPLKPEIESGYILYVDNMDNMTDVEAYRYKRRTKVLENVEDSQELDFVCSLITSDLEALADALATRSSNIYVIEPGEVKG